MLPRLAWMLLFPKLYEQRRRSEKQAIAQQPRVAVRAQGHKRTVIALDAMMHDDLEAAAEPATAAVAADGGFPLSAEALDIMPMCKVAAGAASLGVQLGLSASAGELLLLHAAIMPDSIALREMAGAARPIRARCCSAPPAAAAANLELHRRCHLRLHPSRSWLLHWRPGQPLGPVPPCRRRSR